MINVTTQIVLKATLISGLMVCYLALLDYCFFRPNFRKARKSFKEKRIVDGISFSVSCLLYGLIYLSNIGIMILLIYKMKF